MTNKEKHIDWVTTAKTLSEALPYLKRYESATIVIKLGGAAMTDAENLSSFNTVVKRVFWSIILIMCSLSNLVLAFLNKVDMHRFFALVGQLLIMRHWDNVKGCLNTFKLILIPILQKGKFT